MNKRETGAEWEKTAADYLAKQGMQILETNFRCRQGEIDLIGCHEGYLVFAEVKYRRGKGMGNALEAVDYRKQRRICLAADYYRYLHGISEDTGIRYDVIGIQGTELKWIRNAFPHIYVRRNR